jgi:hypothetical protein
MSFGSTVVLPSSRRTNDAIDIDAKKMEEFWYLVLQDVPSEEALECVEEAFHGGFFRFRGDRQA